ncbi:hypothetical protein KQX54_001182 [Cotesia glomerata]|uniref:Uncharacterized protein n=1 Tax=Cotesia glomerata TaxID=32391 RepID=A0AAV7IDZ7_COTGL|nr:hypothetical protein KQX54_001182 [Cotesia glomerata]
MWNNERLHLLDHRLCYDDLKYKIFKSELGEDYDYFVARPCWIKIRLFLFWVFWSSLIVVIILLIICNFCLIQTMCPKSDDDDDDDDE